MTDVKSRNHRRTSAAPNSPSPEITEFWNNVRALGFHGTDYGKSDGIDIDAAFRMFEEGVTPSRQGQIRQRGGNGRFLPLPTASNEN